MDDLKFGAHNKRGDFTPSARLGLNAKADGVNGSLRDPQ
jgi:hypothetical protein